MNCFHSEKVGSSRRTSNRTSLTAAQKYEQRIKSKQTEETGLVLDNVKVINKWLNSGTEKNWIKKRKEIDDWRRNVIAAATNDGFRNPSPVFDTMDSSTITEASTLCSAGEIRRRIVQSGYNMEMPNGNSLFGISKSPSIPLFGYSQIHQRNPNETLFMPTDDDEVFLQNHQSATFQSLDKNSNFLHPSNSILFGTDQRDFVPIRSAFRKYTPQPIRKNRNIQLKSNNNCDYPSDIRPTREMEWIKPEVHLNEKFMKKSFYADTPENDCGIEKPSGIFCFPSTKKNIHQKESSVKIILKNNTDKEVPKNGRFIRTGSLNVKHRGKQDNHFPASPKTNISRQWYASLDNSPRPYLASSGTLNPYSTIVTSTWQPNGITSKEGKHPLVKINSFQNLQFQKEVIPKVSLNNTFLMRFSFGSEPSLASERFVYCK